MRQEHFNNYFHINFIGLINIGVSIKSLDFQVKKELVQSAIRIIKNQDISFRNNTTLQLGQVSCENKGSVILTLQDKFLRIDTADFHQRIFEHELAKISFVSTGDAENLFGYIVKDKKLDRICCVFECDDIDATYIVKIFSKHFKNLSNSQFIAPELPPRVDRSMRLSDVDNTNIINSYTSPLNQSKSTCKGRIKEPIGQPWYQGAIARRDAETILRENGDFLVRKSLKQNDQYILSGKSKEKFIHLLLIDGNGKVRSLTREFESIADLIDYHMNSTEPIFSEGKELKLIFPVS